MARGDGSWTDRLDHHLRRRIRGPLKMWHAHLLLATFLTVIVTLGVAYSVGYWRGQSDAQKIQAQRLSSIRRAGITIPPQVSAVPPTIYAPPKSPSGGVFAQYLPAPGDQGRVGACQCFAFRRQFQYLAQIAHVKQGLPDYLFPSCRFWYWLTGNGLDQGSFFEQYPTILAQVGSVPESVFGWPLPPSGLDQTLPATLTQVAAQHKYGVETRVIDTSPGGGMNAVYGIMHFLNHHVPVNYDQPVWYAGNHSLFDITPTDYWNDLPTNPNGPVAGGHATTLFAYNLNETHNGVSCWFTARNNWGSTWGLGGDYKVSCRLVAQYGFGLEALHLTTAIPQLKRVSTPPFVVTTPHALQPPPPGYGYNPSLGLTQPVAPQVANAWYVKNIHSRSTGEDLAKLLDRWGDYYHVRPIGLAATLGSECRLFTTSTICDRYGGGNDISFGCCQITPQAAAQYGICYYNLTCLKFFDNDPDRAIPTMARIMYDNRNYLRQIQCPTDYPNLNIAWNAGAGHYCSFFRFPDGQAGINYYQDFLGWYSWAWSKASNVNPYAKPKIVCGKRLSLSYNRRAGFWFARFEKCSRYTWPKYGYRQKTVSL